MSLALIRATILSLPPERGFGAFAHRRRSVQRLRDEALELLARQWVKLHLQALDLGDEVLVLRHGLESGAQGSRVFRRNSRRSKQGAPDRAAAGIEREDLLVLGGLADLAQARRVRQFGN